RDRAMLEDELRFGRRRDQSRWRLRRTFRRGADLARNLSRIILETDKKASYVGLATQAFGRSRLVHRLTSSKPARTIANPAFPLFPINHAEAMARDLTGRLRRESWLVSKKRRYLDLGLQVFLAYRNYVRRRFNFDDLSPAARLGFVSRRLTETEVLSWRQDWAERSIHPLSQAA